jgi:hypothetical protein
MKLISSALLLLCTALPGLARAEGADLSQFDLVSTAVVEQLVECRTERSNCWHDFFDHLDRSAFALRIDTPSLMRVGDLHFVCRTSDGRDEVALEYEVPDGFDDGDVYVSDSIANPCPGRLQKIAIRAYRLDIDDADPLISLYAR